MKADFVLADLGGLETDGEPFAELRDAAELFLRAGGHLSWADWRALSPTTQAAFVEAGNCLRREAASAVGIAILSAMYVPERSSDENNAESEKTVTHE